MEVNAVTTINFPILKLDEEKDRKLSSHINFVKGERKISEHQFFALCASHGT